ncbi:MAG: hypothetical protein DRZ76_03115 [Candidatus Nealsonbacteria bacterium]|nr:MAG: hypothetical protein DRZ76_03115 [Candidatus Nealsonbacteria bacterium]
MSNLDLGKSCGKHEGFIFISIIFAPLTKTLVSRKIQVVPYPAGIKAKKPVPGPIDKVLNLLKD